MRSFAMLLTLGASAFAQPEYYNSIYRGNSALFAQEPNAFRVQSVQGRKPGHALDVGMGQGRNAIFLAKQGWEVTGFDSA